MRKLLILAAVPAAVLAVGAALGCRVSEPTRVATIPADVTAVDAGPLIAIAAPPAEQREEALPEAAELPGGADALGKPAPGFTVDSALQKGEKIRLLRGKVSVIHFWATWCGPCTKSFPALQRLQRRYGEQLLAVIALSVDDEPEEIAAFAKRHVAPVPRKESVGFAVAWDQDHRIANLYKPQTMPSTYVIDRTGVIAEVVAGYHDGEIDELADRIRPLF